MDGFTVSTPYEPIIEENQREFKSPKMSLKIDNLLSKYPEWQDEDTRVTLLASFSQPRHVNPEAYDQRLNFWRHVIFEVLNHQIICTSIFALPNVDELSMRLSNCDPTGRRPHGLGHVIASMIGDSLAIPFPDTKRLFQDAGMFYPRQNRRSLLKYTTKASQQKSLASLASEYLIRQPLSYGWRLLVGMDNDHAHGESNRQFYGSVVVLDVLDDCRKIIIESFEQRHKNQHWQLEATNFYGDSVLLSLDQFLSIVNMIFVLKGRRKIESDVDVDLLLYHLAPMIYIHVDVKDGQSAFTMRSDWIIKVGNDTPPSVEEIKIFQLRQFHRQLQSMIDEIGRIMISHAQKAKHALTTNDKSLALFELRRKKLLEANRERRMVSLNQIGDILNSINQAKSDAQVLEVYRAGEATLRTALQSLPTKEIVSDLVTGLQVLLTDQVEISTLLSSPQNVNFSDEASLEAELDELLISVKTPSLIDLMPSVADMSKDLKAKISEDSMNIFEPLSVHLEPDNTEDICDRLDRVRIQS